MTNDISKKTILILGAGFGGVSAARFLIEQLPPNFGLIIIDNNNYHDFKPALYEVATAHLGKEEFQKKENFLALARTVDLKLEEIFPFHGAKILNGEVAKVSADEEFVTLKNGQKIHFDYLLIALGSETNFFNIPHLKERSFGLKNVDDALNIRNALDEIFYRKKEDEKINILIGGGGFTGTEFASELVFYLKKLAKIHPHQNKKIEIKVIEAQDSLLSHAPRWIKDKARKRLEKLGIEIHLNQFIKDVSSNYLLTEKSQRFDFDILIWTAGIRACKILENIKNIELIKGCVVVNDFLQVDKYKNIFAIGDNAFYIDPKSKKPVPGSAQVAMAQGETTAKNILRQIQNKQLEKYKYEEPHFIIPLGGKYALAEFGLLRFSGTFGWLIKQFTFLRYFLRILPAAKALKLFFRDLKIFTQND